MGREFTAPAQGGSYTARAGPGARGLSYDDATLSEPPQQPAPLAGGWQSSRTVLYSA